MTRLIWDNAVWPLYTVARLVTDSQSVSPQPSSVIAALVTVGLAILMGWLFWRFVVRPPLTKLNQRLIVTGAQLTFMRLELKRAFSDLQALESRLNVRLDEVKEATTRLERGFGNLDGGPESRG
jgi:hypothetical protein